MLASSGLEEDGISYSDSFTPVAESVSSADIPSSSVDLMDTSSDSSDSSGENTTDDDGQRWRCEECSETLATCQCPNSCSTYHCTLCGLGEADMQFCNYCSKCHNADKGPCGGCWNAANTDPEDVGELSHLFWDVTDGIWRCALCQWEVEANSDEEGHCHCSTQQDNPVRICGTGPRCVEWCRRIELSQYVEFEPADSDSSVADSTDSEPDSGDEEFIEDDGPFIPSFLNLLAGNYDPFENFSVSATQAKGTDTKPETHMQDGALSHVDGPSTEA